MMLIPSRGLFLLWTYTERLALVMGVMMEALREKICRVEDQQLVQHLLTEVALHD